jgi:hypothetical protein
VSKKKTAQPPAAAGPAEPRTLDTIRADLVKAEKRLDSVYRFDPGYSESVHRVHRLRSELAAAELQATAKPEPMGFSFQERDVELTQIEATGNHREQIDDLALAQLARSIEIHGLQQRVGLREIAADRYELIFGARRLAACRQAGFSSIPAKIYSGELTPAEVEILRTIENFGRQDLTPVEKAIAVARTIDAITATLAPLNPDYTGPATHGLIASEMLSTAVDQAGGLHAYIGAQLGFPVKWVRDHAYVAELGGEARALLAANRISIGHARELAKLGDKERADAVAMECAKNEDGLGGRDVDHCRRRVAEHIRSLKVVPWQLDVAFGKGVDGCTGQACSTCKFNSKADPDLFGGVMADQPEAGSCTHEACFKAKQDITAKAQEKAVRKMAVKVEAGKLDANESTAQQFVEVFVKPAPVARRVKSITAAPADAAAKDATSSKSGPTAEDLAERKFEEAKLKWMRVVQEAMVVTASGKEDEDRVFALIALSFLPFTEFNGWGGDEINDEDLALLKLAANPSKFGTLAKKVLETDNWADSIFDDMQWTPKALQVFIDGWKLEVPPAPTLADFLPKPKKPAAAKDAGKLTDVRYLQSSYWRDRVESIGDFKLDFTGDELDAALDGLQLGPRSPNDKRKGLAARIPRVFEIQTIGGVFAYAVTMARVETDRTVYELHPLRDPQDDDYETWDALAADHAGVAPEEVPLAGLMLQLADSGLMQTIASNDARLIAVPKASASTKKTKTKKPAAV